MEGSTTKSAFLRGVMLALPFTIVVAPFAMLFGIVATEAGLDLAETMGFAILVIAGAAQFTALQLLVDQAETWAVLAAALAVNLRMAMYSASLVPWIGRAPFWQRALVAYVNIDQTYAASITAYERDPAMTVTQRIALFLGTAAPVAPLWYLFTVLGALLGTGIPDAWALDFALPITFIAMVGPMLKSVAHVAAAATSVALSLLLAGLPSGLGLLAAAFSAMLVGALVEMAMERRR
ncbi:putative branched-subunit amino acid permease [Palleronia aestuarii]|uniref:Putative branched-subunit amino acid permease n=1 Tax=Palleronia aestuarii TaxID=568105 RepID=A0A2W7NJF3_9RHOB|nr:AzlC family ABC transporter permease [Palleronia aestuarii]PZX19573.1 putative branched-subunit amino acid permease [Palleronia aestuarii]